MPPRDNIQMETLILAVDKKARNKSDLLERLGTLLTQYKNHKVGFKEETFTMFDLADYIHTEITLERDNNLFFLLVGKFKKAANANIGLHEDAEIDPRKPFQLQELDAVFADLCDKNQREIQILSGFLEE
jgi:hypothetical protein